MELRRIKLSEELKEARKTLFDISFINDMDEDFVGTSHAYAVLEGWLLNWTPTFEKVYSFLSGSVNIGYSIRNELQGYRQERDPEIFNEIRPILVGFIDLGLNKVDQKCEVRPLLEEYIERVQDAKLAELLKEFNAVKNTAPNFAAMGFRTILSLIIQEKAKRVSPTSKTAIRTDLAPQQMIDSARNDQILSSDEQRLINSFVSTHKDIYDFVTHRPNILADKKRSRYYGQFAQ